MDKLHLFVELQPLEVLEKVTTPEATKLSEKELEKIETQEEATMTNLRLFLRDVLTRLARDRRFKVRRCALYN